MYQRRPSRRGGCKLCVKNYRLVQEVPAKYLKTDEVLQQAAAASGNANIAAGCSSNPAHLSKSRIAILEQMGFRFTPRAGQKTPLTFEERLEQFKAWKAKHGTSSFSFSLCRTTLFVLFLRFRLTFFFLQLLNPARTCQSTPLGREWTGRSCAHVSGKVQGRHIGPKQNFSARGHWLPTASTCDQYEL
jgi:hypothetical protein